MNPVIYQYEYQGPAQHLPDVFWITANHTVLFLAYLTAAFLAIAMLAWAFNRQERGGVGFRLDRSSLLIPSVALLAMFFVNRGYVDEVSINLKHAYNLWHFGLFSFSSTRMVDGTVEFLYYLLLAPFGSTARSLVLGDFLLGFAIAWLHLFILWKYFEREGGFLRLAIGLLFALDYPWIALLSDGFGNALVSLAFLSALYFSLKEKHGKSALAAAVLPLIRPDAILFSYAALYASRRETARWPAPRKLAAWLAPAAALFLYCLAVRIFYGHWIPTPISFKSVNLRMLPMFTPGAAFAFLQAFFREPIETLAVFAVAGSVLLGDDRRLKTIRAYFVPVFFIYVFYLCTSGFLTDWTASSYSRYWIGLEAVLFLSFSEMAAHLFHRTAPPVDGRLRKMIFGRLLPLFLVFSALWGFPQWSGLQDRNYLGYAGEITQRIVPADFTIAASEMDTFGLVMDREVADLWGYTTPEIAHSTVCSEGRIRSNPDYFMKLKPDVYWSWEPSYNFNGVESYLAGFSHTSKTLNVLGDLHRVLAEYDVVLIKHPKTNLFYLVKRTSVPALSRSLLGSHYRLLRQRDFDLKFFSEFYDKERLVQYRC